MGSLLSSKASLQVFYKQAFSSGFFTNRISGFFSTTGSSKSKKVSSFAGSGKSYFIGDLQFHLIITLVHRIIGHVGNHCALALFEIEHFFLHHFLHGASSFSGKTGWR